MKKWEKTSTLLAAVLAASTLLAGCGDAADGNSADSGSTSGSGAVSQGGQGGPAHPIGDGSVTLTIFCDFQTAARSYYTDLGDNPVVQWIEKDTGLNLEFIHAPVGDDGTFFQNMLAGGDLPDLIFSSRFQTHYPGGVEGAINDGLLYDVTELVEQNAPNFWALCDDENDPDIQKKIRGDQGMIIKFGSTFLPPTDNNKVFNGLVIRQDWLDKYDLEAPVTLDEYTEVLRTFKENGVEYPLALCEFFNQSQFSANNPIASAFGVSVKEFDLDADGNVHYCRTQDGYKEFLKFLHGWAEEGLIDEDLVSRSIDDALRLFQGGQAGMCFAHTYNVKQSVAVGPASDPEFKLLCLEMPKINASDETHLSSPTRSINSNSWQVYAKTKYPEEAVAFIDYLMSPDTLLLTAWGTNEGENKTYQINADGQREFTEFVTNNPDGLDYDTVRALNMCAPFQIKYDETMEASQYSEAECHQSWDAWGKQNDGDWNLPRYLTLTTAESEELTRIKQDLANYSDEMVYKFIFGQEDIDANWDAFVAELERLGSTRGEEINKEAYNRYLERGSN
ncbi:MAG: extracellular solute-binding protein [Lachnospiraceae bacterium]|nr:extracellular solute-binding protein [Lachnospiraceae bacterium]MCM1215647.1 extracellular solute-binding protein [Lachnospiraceae bacterium]MCM1238483.1 extracellular solute-binding protein [Lachnospiraceae bacterium]